MPDKKNKRKAKPVKALKYGPFVRWSDWRCAGKDAKCGTAELLVPATGAAAPPPVTVGDTASPQSDGGTWATARTVQLGQLGRGRAEQAWARFQEEVAGHRIRLEQVRADGASARTRLETATHELKNLPKPSEEDLRRRANGEQDTAPEVVSARRMNEHTKRKRAMEADVVKARAAVLAADQEAAQLRERIQVRFDVVRTEAAIIDAYVRRRTASYLGRLIRRHPDGQRIGVLIRSGWPDRPEWTTWRDASRLGAAPAPIEPDEPNNTEEAA